MVLSLLKIKVVLSTIEKSAGQYIAFGHWINKQILFCGENQKQLFFTHHTH